MFVVAFGFFDLLSLGPLIMRYIAVVRVTLNTRGFSAAYCGLLASCSILSYGGGKERMTLLKNVGCFSFSPKGKRPNDLLLEEIRDGYTYFLYNL